MRQAEERWNRRWLQRYPAKSMGGEETGNRLYRWLRANFHLRFEEAEGFGEG